jgi:branched-chain amino acid aminotransferase
MHAPVLPHSLRRYVYRQACDCDGERASRMSGFSPAGLEAYVDGQYIDAAEAHVSIFDHGLLYGDGVFEGMRLFAGGLFRPRDHLARLARSARALSLEAPLAGDALLAVVVETVRRSKLRDAHVRIVITRGYGAPGLDPARCERPTLVVVAYPFPPQLGEKSLRLAISAFPRKAPRVLGAHVKSLNYLDSIVAHQQAKAGGADDAIMLDVFGAVAECTSSNLFMVVDGTLVTPTTRAALPGITRRTILELASEAEIPVEIRDIWPMELYAADAAFVTGSGAGVVPVGEIDGHVLGGADNGIVARLIEGYRGCTRDPRYFVPT